MLYVFNSTGVPVGNPNAKLNPFQESLEWWGYLYMQHADDTADVHLHCLSIDCVAIELEQPPEPDVVLAPEVLLQGYNHGIDVIRRHLYSKESDPKVLEANLVVEMVKLGVLTVDTSAQLFAEAWNTKTKVREDYPYLNAMPTIIPEPIVVNVDPTPESPYPGDVI